MDTKVRTKDKNTKEDNSLSEQVKKIYQEFNDNRIKINGSDEKVKEDRELILNMIMTLFKEICENENVKMEDIHQIGAGGFVNVFKVGDKVVKIGMRYTKTYPNNPYVISPLLRNILATSKGKKREGIWVEVIEYADVLDETTVTEEELYELYSKMRDIGLEWLDIDPDNVGRLRKDNIIHWNDSLEPNDSALNLSPKVGNDIILKKGDLVIIDDDFIYEEGKVPIEQFNNFNFIDTWKEFSKRYNEEHKDKCL